MQKLSSVKHFEGYPAVNENLVLLIHYSGFIDGSLMRITPPPGSDGIFQTRKQFPGFNNQFYVDSRMFIRDYYVGKHKVSKVYLLGQNYVSQACFNLY